jgi:class 3 adenylate cyclase
MKSISISQRIEGTPKARMLREFFLNSGLFQIFFLTYIAANDGIKATLADPANYLLLISAVLQTWVIERFGRHSAWKTALFLLIAPLSYSLADIALDGWSKFINSPYHLIYWAFSALLALLTYWRSRQQSLVHLQTILMNILRVSLFPSLYFVAERYSPEITGVLTYSSFIEYWSLPGHAYILSSSLMFGLLIGVSEASRNQSFALLQHLAKRLHELTGWSFDDAFTESSVEGVVSIQGQRTQIIILFMDIRGFTQWSEKHQLHEIIAMLNAYYETAEQCIVNAGGAKPQFTGDEVMTWFTPDHNLLERIQTLKEMSIKQLTKSGLTVGIGVHYGEVIEGLVGSSTTKAIRITGDPVNTCARICSAALPGELLLSEDATAVLKLSTTDHEVRQVVAKGKQHTLKVYGFT